MEQEPQPSSGRPLYHTVQNGDTLESVAKQYYGSASAWPRLFHANRHVGTFAPGKTLVIPR